VFVALGIQPEIHMRHIVDRGLSSPTIFVYIFSQADDFRQTELNLKWVFWCFADRAASQFIYLSI